MDLDHLGRAKAFSEEAVEDSASHDPRYSSVVMLRMSFPRCGDRLHDIAHCCACKTTTHLSVVEVGSYLLAVEIRQKI